MIGEGDNDGILGLQQRQQLLLQSVCAFGPPMLRSVSRQPATVGVSRLIGGERGVGSWAGRRVIGATQRGRCGTCREAGGVAAPLRSIDGIQRGVSEGGDGYGRWGEEKDPGIKAMGLAVQGGDAPADVVDQPLALIWMEIIHVHDSRATGSHRGDHVLTVLKAPWAEEKQSALACQWQGHDHISPGAWRAPSSSDAGRGHGRRI